jgi:SAM-dependent methyltransferase
MSFLSSDYWTNRYEVGQIGWDLKNVSPPLKEYIDQLQDKDLRILIPGAGYGHEVIYLYQKGFKHVHYLDFSPAPSKYFKKMLPDFPDSQLFCEDFFKHAGEYDLIFEQTMFCAFDPELRDDYVKKVNELLVNGGKLVGLLFNRDFDSGPPFGGTKEEYVRRFESYFSICKMDACYNSVDARLGTELFIHLKKM